MKNRGTDWYWKMCRLACADPKGDRGPRPPPGNYKATGFLRNASRESLTNHKATKPVYNVWPSLACQQNAIKMVFRWRG